MPYDYSKCASVHYRWFDANTYIVVHWLGIPPFTYPEQRVCRWWRVPTIVYSGTFFKEMDFDPVPVYYEDAFQPNLL
jgi:hypothetical protein